MRKLIMVLMLLWCTASLLPAVAQSAGEVTAGQTVEGELGAGETDSWSFRAIAGELLSFRVESRTALDPVLTITDSEGRVILRNDDYAYPESVDSLIEALTMPRTDTYTASVGAYGEGTGAYTLAVTRGYAQTVQDTVIDDAGSWTAASVGDARATRFAGNQLAGSVAGVRAAAYLISDNIAPLEEFYASLVVTNVDNSGDAWATGLALAADDSAYYAFQVNEAGSWRFTVRQADEETVLRDWTTHPIIRPGEPTFTVGLLSRNGGFEFYYNHGYIGSVSSNPLTGALTPGAFIGTTSSLESETVAAFGRLVITTPYRVDDRVILPDRLVVGDAQTMSLTLVRRHLVSADGSIVLTVPESFVQYARPGVNRLMLGGGVQYATFAMGANVRLEQGTTGVGGCGLVFRFTSENDYWLAYLDSAGGAGLSQRAGENFAPGVFAEGQPLERGSEHHLLVIATQNTLYFYVDGRLIGSAEAEAASGQIGAAVVNFEGVDTSCSLRNLWVWNWS